MVAVMLACDACGSASVEAGQILCNACRKPRSVRVAALATLHGSLVAFYVASGMVKDRSLPFAERAANADRMLQLARGIMRESVAALDAGASEAEIAAVVDIAKGESEK